MSEKLSERLEKIARSIPDVSDLEWDSLHKAAAIVRAVEDAPEVTFGPAFKAASAFADERLVGKRVKLVEVV